MILSKWQTIRVFQAAVVLLALTAGSGRAALIVPPASGLGVSVPPGGNDANWKVVALPTNYTPSTSPYAAFVFSGTDAGSLPGLWLGGPTNVGTEGARWIGVRDVPNSLFAPTPPSPPQSDYTTIYAYEFNSPSAEAVEFNF